MNRFFFSARFLVAASLATAALGAATVAEARPDVFVSIGLNGGPGWVEPARGPFVPQPVYVQPQPVYVQPQPVYVQPQPVYVQPQPVYVQPRPFYAPAPVFVRPPAFGRYDARVEWERERAWRHAEWRHHAWHDDFRGDDRDGDDHGRRHGHGNGWRD